jgi:hypothetical protein
VREGQIKWDEKGGKGINTRKYERERERVGKREGRRKE